jgi:hypothetical protein
MSEDPEITLFAKLFYAPAEVKLISVSTENYNLHDSADVSKLVGNVDPGRAGKVTGTIYYSGDYTYSYIYLRILEAYDFRYNLLISNCVQQSTVALSVSNSSFLSKISIVPNAAYRKAYWEKFSKKSIVPS